jgi:hypothetical protein
MAPFTATKLSPSFFSAKPRHIAIQARQPNIPLPSRLNRYVADVKRTRDPAVLETCDIVVDVGAVYDESKNLFDHHQRGFTEVFGHGFETKLSSAGLVFKFVRKVVPFFRISMLVAGTLAKRSSRTRRSFRWTIRK